MISTWKQYVFGVKYNLWLNQPTLYQVSASKLYEKDTRIIVKIQHKVERGGRF